MPGTSTSTLEVTNISKHGFWLLLDRRELFLPFEDFPWFKRRPSGGNPAPRAAGAWAPPLAGPRRRSSHRLHRTGVHPLGSDHAEGMRQPPGRPPVVEMKNAEETRALANCCTSVSSPVCRHA
jgi:hypothetical protein